jgi:hypothetical protein
MLHFVCGFMEYIEHLGGGVQGFRYPPRNHLPPSLLVKSQIGLDNVFIRVL